MNKEIITKAASMAALRLKAHAPEIALAAGIISVTAGTVLACKASMKLEKTVDAMKEKKDALEAKKEALSIEEYPKKERGKDSFIFYKDCVKHVVKLYGVPAAMYVGGIGLIISSHAVIKGRNAALISAYNSLDAATKAYRERVKEAIGEEAEEKIFHPMEDAETVETSEDGKEKKKKVKAFSKEDEYSPYARFFDEFNPNWERDPQNNLTKLKAVQEIATNKLHSRGYLFLNEVYDALGFPKTKEGQLIGWIESKTPYVDFGIYDGFRKAQRDFVNGLEPSILLDFNVSGVIIDDFERAADSKL